MAVVGEAHVLVKAITTGFDGQLRRQLRGLAGSVAPDGRAAGESLGHAFNRGFNRSAGDIFGKVAEGLKTMYPEAENARLVFRSLVRTSYTVGTALTVVVGGIGALIGGLVTLVAAVGRALPGLAAFASALVQIRLAAAFATFSMKGIGGAVSAATEQNRGMSESLAEINERFQQLQFSAEEAALSEGRAALNLEKALENLRRTADLPPNSAARREAQLAYDEAELAYRKAKDRTRDLNEEVAKGPQAAGGAGADPYAGLTESQKKFAQFLVGLRPKLDVLREAVASGFLPVLQNQIQQIVDLYFPDLEDAFERIGVALGQGATNVFDNFLDEGTKSEVNEFFDNLEKNLPLIGEIFGDLGEVLLKVFNDADGIGTKFLEFVRDTLIDWNTYLDEFGLTGTFENAFGVGSRLFGIIGNTLDGLGDFFALLDGEGGAIDILLGYLEELTGNFAALGDEGNTSAEGVAETFAGLASNFGPVVDFIGNLLNSLLKLGASPSIGEFFEKLNNPDNAANWDNIFKSFADAGPAFADLIITIGDLFAAFADEGAPTAFFETLTSLIQPIADFFGDPNVKPFIDDIAVLFARFTALTFVFEQLKFFFFAFVGIAISGFQIFSGIGKVFKFFKDNGPKIFGNLAKPLEFIKGLFGNITKIIGGIFTRLLPILRLFTGPLGIAILAVTAMLQFFFTQTEKGQEIFAALQNIVGTVVENIKSFFGTLWTNLTAGWDDFVESIKSFSLADVIKGMINGVIGFFEFLINEVLKSWNNGLLKNLNSLKIPSWVPLIGGRSLDIPEARLLSIPRLAEGGVVAPSMGGTIAQIAEAGRPERVEPLDANGLSKRDYALIDALRGGGSGINITVNPSADMDERELAALVSRRIAYEIKRGAI